MAVVITDNRTDPTNGEADSITGWVGSIAPSLKTSEPNPVELTGSLGQVVSTSVQDIYLTISSTNMSAGTLVYVWQLPQGIMDTIANGGQGVILYDGTDRIGYHTGGSDKAGFRHNGASVAWQCMVIDTASLPAIFTERAGIEASLTLTAITGVGAMYKTLAKSVGGAVNCFTDIIRIGNGGLTITGGGSGTEGNFAEIALEDSSDVSLKAYGICHEVASGVFGLQGPLTFGDSVGTSSVDFLETDSSIVFEDRGLGTDKYFINIEGNATGTTSFQLGTKAGTTGGSNGVAMTSPVGVGASFDASDINVEFVLMYGGQLANYDQGVTFSGDATNAPNHEIFAYIFSGCAQIDPGLVLFKNNSIVNTTDANGGLLIDEDGTTNINSISFISDGTGHAIHVRPTGAGPFTFAITSMTFSGYGASDTTNAEIYIDPVTQTANITLNITDGLTPTTRKAVGYTGTLTVNNNKAITFTNMKDNTEVRIYKTSDDSVVDGIENATAGTTDARTFTWSSAAGLDVYYVLHNWNALEPFYQTIRVEGYIVPSSDTSIAIQQQLDRNAE